MWNDEIFFRELLDNLYDGVYFVDRDRIITYWNKAAERLSGYSGHAVLGRSCRDNILNHVDSSGKVLCLEGCPLQATMVDGKARQAEVFMRHRDGHRVPVQVRASPIRDERGEIIGAVEIFSDNTAMNEALHKLHELQAMAYIDPLTALPNRRYLQRVIQSRLNELKRYGWSFGVLFIDVDHFKNINDTYGHETGDQILKMTAKTLSVCSRPFDVVGRWGGEEFVAVNANVDRTNLLRVAERFRAMIEQSGLPVGEKILQITVSVGATLALPGDTEEELLQRADGLMYRSKLAGRNRVTGDTLPPP